MQRKKKIISGAERFVKDLFKEDSSGHDWWHVCRVRNLALTIASEEKGLDIFVVELAALLHDVDDWKLSDGSMDRTRGFLESYKLDDKMVRQIIQICKEVSFKGAGVKTKMSSKEGEVVQDADRIDALGAIGIARCFAFGGSRGRALYDPRYSPKEHASFEQYKDDASHSINHFFEKLLLLKDRMNTASAKRIAEKRHLFMQLYLKQFFAEWQGDL